MTRGLVLKCKTHQIKHPDMSTILEPTDPSEPQFCGTKIVGTIGPSCQSVEVLTSLLEKGMTGARVDLTWGPLEFHRKSLENLQVAMKKSRKLCCTMIDTLGRELMIRRHFRMDESGWPTHNESYSIKSGQVVTITTRSDVEASNTVLPITYERFTEMAQPGDTIYIGRYLVCGADSASLYLRVLDVQGTEVVCEAQNDAVLDGLLTVFHVERSTDTLSNVQNELPLLSDYDKECLAAMGAEYEIDFVSLSYTRTRQDLRDARKFLDSVGMKNTKLIAKIETRQALINVRGILAEADGVIISRGNLGLDCVPEKMALVQKNLMQLCNLVGKPVLITRVVDTMVDTPRPTRAEATDVANAVLDGCDGIVLGAETLRGKYPIESVTTIVAICRQAEKVFDHAYHSEHLMEVAADLAGDDELSTAGCVSPQPSSGALDAMDHAGSSGALSSLNGAIRAMTKFGMSSSINLAGMTRAASLAYNGTPYLSKLESIASSAVRAADKVGASLIVVYTHSGKTAQLVAKYRPPMPIVTLVVPRLVSDSLHWRLEGRLNARQCLLSRGLLPILAAPSPSGDAVLEEAIAIAAKQGLVKPHQHVVCVQRIHDDFCVKIVSVDHLGAGIRKEPLVIDTLPMRAYNGAVAKVAMRSPDGRSVGGLIPSTPL